MKPAVVLDTNDTVITAETEPEEPTEETTEEQLINKEGRYDTCPL